MEIIDGVTIRRFQYLWPVAWQTLCYDGGAAVNLKRNKLKALAIPFLSPPSSWQRCSCCCANVRPSFDLHGQSRKAP